MSEIQKDTKPMKTFLIAILTLLGVTMFAPQAEARQYYHGNSHYRHSSTRYYGGHYGHGYYGAPYYGGYYGGGCYRPGVSLVFRF